MNGEQILKSLLKRNTSRLFPPIIVQFFPPEGRVMISSDCPKVRKKNQHSWLFSSETLIVHTICFEETNQTEKKRCFFSFVRTIYCVGLRSRTHLNKFFYEFVCFSTILKVHKWTSENPNLAQNRRFCQNYQKSINVGFCDNSINRSLVLILKYMFYKFYGWPTILKKMRIFWIKKKTKKNRQNRTKKCPFSAAAVYNSIIFQISLFVFVFEKCFQDCCKNWFSIKDPCGNWKGVECIEVNTKSYLYKIDLSNCRLHGTVPQNNLNWRHLERLNLKGNDLIADLSFLSLFINLKRKSTNIIIFVIWPSLSNFSKFW